MFFIKFSDVRSLFLLGFYILLSFFLPDLCLNLISFNFFLLSDFLVLNLLHEIVLGVNFLLVEFLSSLLFIFHFGFFSGKILGKNSLVFKFLLSFMIFDNSFSHHVHKLSLSSFSISHFISSFLFLSFNKSGVFFLGFNISESLVFRFFLLDEFVSFIFFKHSS